jgi:pimeloyl-ACP methyl ester carboxylesterase
MPAPERMRMRWLKRIGLGLVALLAIFIFGWAPYYLAGLATTRRIAFNDRENAGLTPASFDLPFEEVAFRTDDGVEIKGWWVPAPQAKGTVVMVHGLNRSRIEMIKKVPFVHGRGWNALLYDQRHHGQSGGDVSTFGWLERKDVHAAKGFARSRAGGPVVYWGISLGAAAATLAAAEDAEVAGLVCDSTYRSLSDTVRHHLRLARNFRWWLRVVPAWPVADEVLFWIGRRGGFDPKAVDVRAAATRLSGRPCLFVCNSGDRRMPAEIAYELKAAAGPRAQLLVVPGNSHGGAWRDGTAAYESAVSALLEEALGAEGRLP